MKKRVYKDDNVKPKYVFDKYHPIDSMKPLKNMWLKAIQLIALITCFTSADAQLKADFSASPTVGCPPVIVDFKDLTTGAPTSWKWDLGNGTTSIEQNPKNAYFDPGQYTVKLVVKNAVGADSIVKSQVIIVNAPPAVNFKASDSTGCFPLKVNFSDLSTAGSGTIASWQWDFGDGTLSTLQNPDHTYTNAGSFTVTLRVVNSNGCVKVFTKPNFINLADGVKANFSFLNVGACQSPSPVIFTNTTQSTGLVNYKWNFGDGKSSTAINPINNYANAGTYTVQLIATNTSGCSDTLTKINAVSIGFVKASFTFKDSACVNETVSFANTSTPEPTTASWYFSDGTMLTGINVTKAFASAGVYQVKLVNNYGSCADSTIKTITIKAKPKASFNATNTSGCVAPLTVNFQNTSTNGITYKWNFGDGATSTQQSPTHTYTTPGAFSVRLIVTNATGCTDTLDKADLVKVTPPRIVFLGNLPVKGCLPYTISPQAVIQSIEKVTSYFWDFGDGSTSTDSFPKYTYTKPGFYTVKLKIVTGAGCIDSFTHEQAVQVGSKPLAKFSATPRDACAEVPIVFKDVSGDSTITEWLWNFGDGIQSVVKDPKHFYVDTGFFNITLVVTSMGCADTLEVKKYIHISPPIASFDTAYFCTDRLTRKFKDKSIGATSWSWDFGDGNTSTQQNPTHTYAKPGRYNVVLKVSNGTCVNTNKKEVLVVKELGELVYSSEISCRDSRVGVNVINIDKSNIQNYSWYFAGLGGPVVTTVSAPVAQNFNEAGTFSIAVVTYDVLGCRDTLGVAVPIKIYGPQADFSLGTQGICLGNTITLNETSLTDQVHPITKYIWDYGDGKKDTLAAAPFKHQYDSVGVFSVKLLVQDSYGCKDSIAKPNILTVTNPKAQFRVSDTLICPNIPITFTNESTGGVSVNYLWSFGDGSTSTKLDTIRSYKQQGSYVVNLKMVDKFGCTSNASTNIKVFPALANFTVSDSFGTCPPLLVDFNNTSTNFVNFSWDFGDGGTSSLSAPSHLYTYPGTYSAKLWVNSNGGCADTLKKVIKIQGPTGVFNYTPTTVCSPSDIQFTATTKNAVRYFWDFNDGTGNYSDSTKATHTYSRPGDYLPKMILEDASGCPVPIVGPDTIHVKAITTNILAENKLICDSGYVSFSDSTWSNDEIAGFLWEFGDGTKSTDRAPKHLYDKPGMYNIKMTATTKFGCTDVASLNNFVKIIPSPAIAINGDTSACEPGSLTFTGNLLKADTSTLSWSWNMGNGNTSSLQNPGAQSYLKAGNYPIKAVVINADGCATTVERTATIHPIPVVDAGVDSIMCLNAPINLMATGADMYTWQFHPTLSCLNCATPTANPKDSITYKVTGKTIYGCTGTDSVTVLVRQPFVMSVNNGDTLCIGESYGLKANGAKNYEWFPSTYLDNSKSATPKAKPETTITYQVVGKDDKSCFSDTGYVTIQVYPIPKIEIEGNNPINLSVGSALTLKTKNSSDVTGWKWYPSTGLDCNNCPNPIASPREKITYSVQATNAGGCVSKDDVTVVVICDNSNVYVPNSFSPNGDGANDQFYPRGTGVFNIKSFKIFNRWGQIVYSKSNVNANVASDGWDGTMNGVKLTSDVYVYCIEVVCQNSVVLPIIGNVTLIR